jgi:tagatose-6-phosphate ketose/aldose isomerase
MDLLLASAPEARHLVITCNADGRLATGYKTDRRVALVTLDPRTNDRSLVMTSSFTNMVLTSRFLGMIDSPDVYRTAAQALSQACRHLLSTAFDSIGQVAIGPFERAVFLGTGCRHGAAREASLKMLEMTGGHVATMAETYLGLRHGSMSFLNERTLVVAFLSSDAINRAYELDLIEELGRKQLGWRKLLAGATVPSRVIAEGDVAIPYSEPVTDDYTAILDVVVGQVLAFHKCLALGLSPDSPSATGVISRVVSRFQLHPRRQGRPAR